MAGPGQIGPSILTVDMLVGTGSELVSSPARRSRIHVRIIGPCGCSLAVRAGVN